MGISDLECWNDFSILKYLFRCLPFPAICRGCNGHCERCDDVCSRRDGKNKNDYKPIKKKNKNNKKEKSSSENNEEETLEKNEEESPSERKRNNKKASSPDHVEKQSFKRKTFPVQIISNEPGEDYSNTKKEKIPSENNEVRNKKQVKNKKPSSPDQMENLRKTFKMTKHR